VAGRKPGPSPKSNYKWTDSDWELIGKALDEGLGGSAVEKLGWLPHLNQQQIRNGLNILRRKRDRLCGKCQNGLDPAEKYLCEACKQSEVERRREKIAQGACVGCSESLDQPGSSATMCPRCIKRHRQGIKAYLAQKPQKKDRGSHPKRYTAFPWPSARSFRPLLPLLPPDLGLVDLFGGSGSFSIDAKAAGKTLIAFNDVHPGVTTFVEAVVAAGAEIHSTVKDEWKSEHPSAPSAFLMGAYRTAGNLTKPTRVLGPPPALKKPAERLQTALKGVPVTNLDFAEAIRRFDGPKTLFVADPPWQGCEDAFEYQLGDRHEELAELLLGAQGEFILMTASNREAIRTWRNAPYLYWKLVGFAKELIVSSFPLGDPKLEPVDPEKFGLAA
jgi:site-specific DNA-adenine methylase